MHVKGNIYIIARPDAGERGAYHYVVHNEGDVPLTATHNVVPRRGFERHDDVDNFGHGLKVLPTKVSEQLFPAGMLYGGSYGNKTPIEPGQIFRAGARRLFWEEVELPPMEEGQVIKIPFDSEDPAQDRVHWMAKPQEIGLDKLKSQAESVLSFSRPGLAHCVRDGDALLGEVQALLDGARAAGPRVKGTARITAVPNEHGLVSRWEVRFSNDGRPEDGFSPFIGTVSFADATSKNAGTGLEAMACPEPGSSAVQRLEAGSNYGVTAEPGAFVRLGVRGLSYREVELPKRGTVEYPLASFRKVSTTQRADFFELEAVKNKRAEKAPSGKVQFFIGDEPLNNLSEPVTYLGSEAVAESDYPVPEIQVQRVTNFSESQGRRGSDGWIIRVTSRMGSHFPADFPNVFPPDFPDEGLRGKPIAGQPMGFIATPLLNGLQDDHHIKPQYLWEPNQECRWFIRDGAIVSSGGVHGIHRRTTAGSILDLSIDGTGLSISVPLPSSGGIDISPQSPAHYRYRPDQVEHGRLTHPAMRENRDAWPE